MADELDVPTGAFSIMDTMEMAGNPELLKDLLSPETSTGNPDDISPIIKEAEDKNPLPESKPRGKEIVPKEEGKEYSGQDIVNNFLGDSTDQQEDVPEGQTKEPVEEVPEQESQFTALSKDLYRLGVFTAEEGEDPVVISTPEEFLERFNAEKQKGAIVMVNNFISQFGEDYQDAFEAIYVKGVNPKDYFGIYNTIVDFTKLDLTDESNQIAVMKQALTDQGLEPDDVVTEIDRLKNYGDLESVASKHHKVLVKKEAARLQQMETQAERDLQQKTGIKNQYIQNVQSILQEKLKAKEFDGIPINPKLVNELQDFLLVDKYKTASGETLTDFDRTILELKRPENHTMKVKVALLLKILEKDPTLSTIQRTGVSKKSDQVFSELARQVTTSGKSNNAQQPKSWFTQ
jgi:hypothetical protein